MIKRTGFADGTPCWIDLMVADPGQARDFYRSILGWTYQVSGPERYGHTLCLADGVPVAGISPLQPGAQETPSAWNLYLAATDADQVALGIKESGGTISIGPVDVLDAGRMIFAFDPAGTPFCVWQGRRHPGFQRSGEPGSFAWAELITAKPAVVDRFFESVFGYQRKQVGDGKTIDYSVWSIDGDPVCGRYRRPQTSEEPHEYWAVYLAVDDVDATCGRVVAGGGAVCQPPEDSPHGRFAGVYDVEGARFNLIDPSRVTVSGPA